MKRSLSKTIFLLGAIVLVALAFPASALADSGGEGGMKISQTINGYQVTLVFEKPASVGENPIQIQIVDAMGMPVVGAEVEVSLAEPESDHAEAEADGHDEPAEANGHDEPVENPDHESEAENGMPGMDGMEAQPTPTVEIASMNSMAPQADMADMDMVALAAGHESGEYEGEIAIESDGDLVVRAHITIQGKLHEVDFPIHVAKSNTGFIILVSFMTVNVALVAAAFVMKPKPLSVNTSKKA